MAETKPLTTANIAKPDEQAKPSPTPKPVPSQAKADDIREESIGEDPPKKPKEKTEKSPDPFPTQADLDAMRAGTFKSYVTR
jgi:hypothetical protein